MGTWRMQMEEKLVLSNAPENDYFLSEQAQLEQQRLATALEKEESFTLPDGTIDDESWENECLGLKNNLAPGQRRMGIVERRVTSIWYLRNTKHTLAEIAAFVGYKTVESFWGSFKHAMECTPTQYRAKCAKQYNKSSDDSNSN
jgi:AraC-like DNA-binding protein